MKIKAQLAPLLFLLALSMVFSLDCFTPISADSQTMQCCGSMPCNPGNSHHDCCKTMASSQSPSVLPAEHSVLSVPVATVVEHLSAPAIVMLAEVSQLRFEAPQHSPPELYTLHSSLLI